MSDRRVRPARSARRGGTVGRRDPAWPDMAVPVLRSVVLAWVGFWTLTSIVALSQRAFAIAFVIFAVLVLCAGFFGWAVTWRVADRVRGPDVPQPPDGASSAAPDAQHRVDPRASGRVRRAQRRLLEVRELIDELEAAGLLDADEPTIAAARRQWPPQDGFSFVVTRRFHAVADTLLRAAHAAIARRTATLISGSPAARLTGAHARLVGRTHALRRAAPPLDQAPRGEQSPPQR